MSTSDLWAVAISVVPLLPLYVVYQNNRRVVLDKKEDLEGLLMKPSVYKAYARAFGRSLPSLASADPLRREAIGRLFNRYYPTFAAPLIIFSLLTWAFTIAGLSRVCTLGFLPTEWLDLLRMLPKTCLEGFLGGYVWALYQIVWRYRSRDLTPSFAHALSIGLLTSSLTAGFVGSLGKYSDAPLLAYAIGFLPTLDIVSWLQISARRMLQARSADLQSEAPTLHHLEGATRSTILRLAEEGIDSAHQLAYADPFLLLLKTNLAWEEILDLIDQSLLFNYLQEQMKSLRPAGIRGAVEFAAVFGVSGTRKDATYFDLLASIADKIGMNSALAQNLVTTVRDDYQVCLVEELFAQAYGD